MHVSKIMFSSLIKFVGMIASQKSIFSPYRFLLNSVLFDMAYLNISAHAFSPLFGLHATVPCSDFNIVHILLPNLNSQNT